MGLERYIYNANIISVYDGDTVTAEIDLGFKVKMEIKIRLARIDAPELKGATRPDGITSRDFVREWIGDGKNLIIKTHKDSKGKYGRYLADIYKVDGDNKYCLNDILVSKGLAVYRKY